MGFRNQLGAKGILRFSHVGPEGNLGHGYGKPAAYDPGGLAWNAVGAMEQTHGARPTRPQPSGSRRAVEEMSKRNTDSGMP